MAECDQPDVYIEVGDLMGAALRADCSKQPAAPGGGSAPEVAHVWEDWYVLRDIFELEVPQDEYSPLPRHGQRRYQKPWPAPRRRPWCQRWSPR